MDTALWGATSTPLFCDTHLRSWPPLSVLTGLLSWVFCQTLPNWPLLPPFTDHDTTFLAAWGLFASWVLGFTSHSAFSWHVYMTRASHAWAEANALRRASDTPTEHVRSPSGTTLLCTLKHRFYFSLSIHQKLGSIFSVYPPIPSIPIHLFVKLKTRISLVKICNVSRCHPIGISSSFSSGLHVHGLWASTAFTTIYYHTNWEEATHKTVFSDWKSPNKIVKSKQTQRASEASLLQKRVTRHSFCVPRWKTRG